MEQRMESSAAERMLTFPEHLSPEALLVREALLARGLETPMVTNGLSRDEKYRRISAAFTDITRTPGPGPARRQPVRKRPNALRKCMSTIFSAWIMASFRK